jgi:hypothetical protein
MKVSLNNEEQKAAQLFTSGSTLAAAGCYNSIYYQRSGYYRIQNR